MKRVAIVTSSDTGYRGEREDLSGPAIREIVEKNGYEVVSEDVLPDDRKMLSERMAEIADSGTAELILTTGGTGFHPEILHRRQRRILLTDVYRGFRRQCVRTA